MPSLVIQLERVEDVWEELDALVMVECDEIDDPRRRGPDWDSMKILNNGGTFRVLTARLEGRMIGYFSWFIDFDMESKGTLIVNQAAWYVEPGHPIVGVKMLDRAIEEFKKAGVQFAYFHHTVHGRGATLGRLFAKKGAELLGYNYMLKVKA